jgi:rhodanese-related sulfurtransferase
MRLIENDSSVVLLDVRNPDEWKSSVGHLRNAVLIPLQELGTKPAALEPLRSKNIIVYCRSGTRSSKAARLLVDQGFHAVTMRGGLREWNRKELPVIQETE